MSTRCAPLFVLALGALAVSSQFALHAQKKAGETPDRREGAKAEPAPVRESARLRRFAAVVARKDRQPQDRRRDRTRKPAEVLDFFGIEEGMIVADVMAGDGYYTELLSRIVGPKGKVYCQNSAIPLRVFAEKPLSKRLADDRLPNVVRLDRELREPGFPRAGLDAAILIRFYHDFKWQKVDRAAFNKTMFRALKPGGIFGVVDHHARKGDADKVGKSLHRVEASLVRKEIEAAGFVLEASSDLLRNPKDTRDWNIFSRKGLGRDATDRFVYRFRKPRAPKEPQRATSGKH